MDDQGIIRGHGKQLRSLQKQTHGDFTGGPLMVNMCACEMPSFKCLSGHLFEYSKTRRHGLLVAQRAKKREAGSPWDSWYVYKFGNADVDFLATIWGHLAAATRGSTQWSIRNPSFSCVPSGARHKGRVPQDKVPSRLDRSRRPSLDPIWFLSEARVLVQVDCALQARLQTRLVDC